MPEIDEATALLCGLERQPCHPVAERALINIALYQLERSQGKRGSNFDFPLHTCNKGAPRGSYEDYIRFGNRPRDLTRKEAHELLLRLTSRYVPQEGGPPGSTTTPWVVGATERAGLLERIQNGSAAAEHTLWRFGAAVDEAGQWQAYAWTANGSKPGEVLLMVYDPRAPADARTHDGILPRPERGGSAVAVTHVPLGHQTGPDLVWTSGYAAVWYVWLLCGFQRWWVSRKQTSTLWSPPIDLRRVPIQVLGAAAVVTGHGDLIELAPPRGQGP